MTLDILHLALSEGGLGLWKPDVCLYATLASTIWRYLQNPTRFGFVQRTALRDWLSYKGIVHSFSRLPLLQLSPCATRGAPWLAFGVKVLSELNKLRSGVSLRWQDISEAPLRNNRVFLSGSQTFTCRYLIKQGVLRVRDLVDSATWSILLSGRSQGLKKLRGPHWVALRQVLQRLSRAWEEHLAV